MQNLNTRVCLSTLLIGFLGIASGAEAENTGGWGKTRWGMTARQVIEAYPQARQLEKPEPQDNNGVVPIKIDSFDIEKNDFEVRFFFDKTKNTLQGVYLSLKEENHLIAEQGFHDLEKALTLKYGTPYYRNEDRKRGALGISIDNKASWKTKGTTIDLSFHYLEGAYHWLVINYQPETVKKGLDDKL